MSEKPNRLSGLMTPSKGRAVPARSTSYEEALGVAAPLAVQRIVEEVKVDTNQPTYNPPALPATRPVTQGKVAMSLRFGTQTYDRLKELSFKTGLPVQKIIDQAVQAYLDANAGI